MINFQFVRQVIYSRVHCHLINLPDLVHVLVFQQVFFVDIMQLSIVFTLYLLLNSCCYLYCVFPCFFLDCIISFVSTFLPYFDIFFNLFSHFNFNLKNFLFSLYFYISYILGYFLLYPMFIIKTFNSFCVSRYFIFTIKIVASYTPIYSPFCANNSSLILLN